MKHTRTISAIATTALALAIPVGPALASNSAGEKETTKQKSTLEFERWNHEVAEDNGYKIVTEADGTKRSVPVTEEAKAQVAAASGGISTFGTAAGDCGTSWVTAAKLANDTLAVSTGYSVYLPVDDKSWQVNALGFVTSQVFQFPGGPTGAVWSASAAGTVIGPGVASVPYFSYVVLENGAVCNSGGPTDGFG